MTALHPPKVEYFDPSAKTNTAYPASSTRFNPIVLSSATRGRCRIAARIAAYNRNAHSTHSERRTRVAA